MRLIKTIVHKIKMRFKYGFGHHLNYRGLYLIDYLISKYIDKTNTDNYVEDYEEAAVNKTYLLLDDLQFFSRFLDKNGEQAYIPEYDKRQFSAFMYIVMTCYALAPSERKKVYNMIKNEETREQLKLFIKMGLVL